MRTCRQALSMIGGTGEARPLSMFGVFFSALTLLVGWQDGRPAGKRLVPLTVRPKVLFWNSWRKKTQGKPTDPGSSKNRPLEHVVRWWFVYTVVGFLVNWNLITANTLQTANW